MKDYFLNRDEAPFTPELWQQIDNTVVQTARSVLAGRKLLPLDGPHGLGMRTLDNGEVQVQTSDNDQVSVQIGGSTPLIQISAGFTLSMHMIAGFMQNGYGLDLKAVEQAARACAYEEDKFIFHGNSAAPVCGLLDSPGVQKLKLRTWDTPGRALDDFLQAVTLLDNAGFAGPYVAALAPELFNQLFRRYSDGDLTGIEHVKQLVTAGIYKAPALQQAVVLLPAAANLAALVVGQDMITSFVGPAKRAYEFCISETLALRLHTPEAVCVLQLEAPV